MGRIATPSGSEVILQSARVLNHGPTHQHVRDPSEGVTYRAASGYTRTAIRGTADLSVDNLDVESVFSDDGMTEEDLRAGRYDFAEIRMFDSGEPYTIALLILWTEDPGNEGIFRSGSANTGNWLWMLSGGRLWGRQANVNSPASGSGPLITAAGTRSFGPGTDSRSGSTSTACAPTPRP